MHRERMPASVPTFPACRNPGPQEKLQNGSTGGLRLHEPVEFVGENAGDRSARILQPA